EAFLAVAQGFLGQLAFGGVLVRHHHPGFARAGEGGDPADEPSTARRRVARVLLHLEVRLPA
ncbi:MAG: hypothetical protein WKF95_13800, partial [Rubrobacter sp.]